VWVSHTRVQNPHHEKDKWGNSASSYQECTKHVLACSVTITVQNRRLSVALSKFGCVSVNPTICLGRKHAPFGALIFVCALGIAETKTKLSLQKKLCPRRQRKRPVFNLHKKLFPRRQRKRPLRGTAPCRKPLPITTAWILALESWRTWRSTPCPWTDDAQGVKGASSKSNSNEGSLQAPRHHA